ncbi:hypothetical protein Achl_4081 (plasmid) [Pseudarthrobacter chlorophenolicus A6]|uniref:Uncharacterized protein n=1 Tax=Pseudarthrobacter chlorophenolicus (strain ATCC 700700 / DSM 12829 / CIP 107037 / JCM 12360 / KCTC 9906 / NCIMB 13794 / A6) TaxID=452863 RepID=B8HHY5_PSECP|nr:hypothetical protein [Pseudarthrobacter chlorophenolicus]ACL42032.1 hypothetical protein Achl_4081 [Pseudarthrobacter chlorophenolicus A6]SDQ20580.1 hypothetical protein SAMN04489738_0731 [Pseudarthrobacter chlorophenolicus]
MATRENRARSFKKSLEAAGYSVVWKPKKAQVPWATTKDLPAATVDMMMVIFRELGGVPGEPRLAPQHWDMQADELLIEFDEDLHFNRYRTLSLATPWSRHLPWSEAYGRYAVRMEGMCLRAGSHGGKWANQFSDRMFGGSDQEGALGPLGPSRWKQRAIYDALKDAYALHTRGVALARVSIHDDIGGLNVNVATKRDIILPPAALRSFIEGRTVPAVARS